MLDAADLDARLTRLEAENRRLRRTLAALVAVAAATLLAGYAPANDRIEASEFAIRDKGGVARARLFVDDTGKTRLVLRDRDGKSAAVLTSGDGASLALSDKEGKNSVVLTGTTGKGVLMLETEGKPKAVLAAPKSDATGTLDVQDPWATPN